MRPRMPTSRAVFSTDTHPEERICKTIEGELRNEVHAGRVNFPLADVTSEQSFVHGATCFEYSNISKLHEYSPYLFTSKIVTNGTICQGTVSDSEKCFWENMMAIPL